MSRMRRTLLTTSRVRCRAFVECRTGAHSRWRRGCVAVCGGGREAGEAGDG